MARPLILLLVIAAGANAQAWAAPRPVPRTILALYDSRYDAQPRELSLHQIAEMPLNHLGLVVRYHDINTPLPSLEHMQDVRGILTSFRSDDMADPIGFLAWADRAMTSGKRFVVLGGIGARKDLKGKLTPATDRQRFWSKLGLHTDDDWTMITYDWEVSLKDRRMLEFERRLTGVLPPFRRVRKVDSGLRSYLVVSRRGDPASASHLVTVGPGGGYAAEGYFHLATSKGLDRRHWYVNPFEFFREAFATDDLPKLDTTTLSGRRIFYSHVDGDGWRNRTELTQYRKDRASSAEVVLREVLLRYPDLPVTIAPIAGDLDPAWHGTSETLRVARQILALPHVEAGSHTYGHPLDWAYFDRVTPAPAPAASGLLDSVARWVRRLNTAYAAEAGMQGGEGDPEDTNSMARRGVHAAPRSYDIQPFDLDLEIAGSIEFINSLLPPGKRVEVLQWSGNTTPYEAAIAASRAAGVRNLNGGDTRFDPEFPSYAWVAPVGRRVGAEWQVYASNSNENTYTNLWTDRFFAFKFLTATLKNTESPRRVTAHNIYFHMYSGEKLPSLRAVLDNYQYAATKELAPITASAYAAVVDGFGTATISELGPRQWQVEHRDGLQTIRFDDLSMPWVDFARSSGVVGQRVHQGSLYVALDPAAATPVIALTRVPPTQPYLVHARWVVSHLQARDSGFSFRATGFGPGVSAWQVKPQTTFVVSVTASNGTTTRLRQLSDAAGALTIDLGPAAGAPVHVQVTRG
jgi:hypothetical protein